LPCHLAIAAQSHGASRFPTFEVTLSFALALL